MANARITVLFTCAPFSNSEHSVYKHLNRLFIYGNKKGALLQGREEPLLFIDLGTSSEIPIFSRKSDFADRIIILKMKPKSKRKWCKKKGAEYRKF